VRPAAPTTASHRFARESGAAPHASAGRAEPLPQEVVPGRNLLVATGRWTLPRLPVRPGRSRSWPRARDLDRAWLAGRRPRCCSVTKRATTRMLWRPLSDRSSHATTSTGRGRSVASAMDCCVRDRRACQLARAWSRSAGRDRRLSSRPRAAQLSARERPYRRPDLVIPTSTTLRSHSRRRHFLDCGSHSPSDVPHGFRRRVALAIHPQLRAVESREQPA
jgi:hypothetical protein